MYNKNYLSKVFSKPIKKKKRLNIITYKSRRNININISYHIFLDFYDFTI